MDYIDELYYRIILVGYIAKLYYATSLLNDITESYHGMTLPIYPYELDGRDPWGVPGALWDLMDPLGTPL